MFDDVANGFKCRAAKQKAKKNDEKFITNFEVFLIDLVRVRARPERTG